MSVPPEKCQRCRRRAADLMPIEILHKGEAQPFAHLCLPCLDRWKETLPLITESFMRGALYPKDGRLFLADEGTWGGVLRSAGAKPDAKKR